MKKIIFVLALMVGLALTSQSQTVINIDGGNTNIYLTNNLNVGTMADSIYVYFTLQSPVKSWSIQSYWTGVTGSGTVTLEVSNFSNFTGYVPYTDSPSMTITGARGADGWEDYMWAWRYGRLKIVQGTLSTGKLTTLAIIK